MNHDSFWERVNEALDARRDPLEDPLVQRAIEADPSRLDELRRLEDVLSALPTRAPQPTTAGAQARSRAWTRATWRLTAATAASAALWVVLESRDTRPDATSSQTPAREVATGAASAVDGEASAATRVSRGAELLDLRVVHTHTTPAGTETTEVDVLAALTKREITASSPESRWTNVSFATINPSPSQP